MRSLLTDHNSQARQMNRNNSLEDSHMGMGHHPHQLQDNSGVQERGGVGGGGGHKIIQSTDMGLEHNIVDLAFGHMPSNNSPPQASTYKNQASSDQENDLMNQNSSPPSLVPTNPNQIQTATQGIAVGTSAQNLLQSTNIPTNAVGTETQKDGKSNKGYKGGGVPAGGRRKEYPHPTQSDLVDMLAMQHQHQTTQKALQQSTSGHGNNGKYMNVVTDNSSTEVSPSLSVMKPIMMQDSQGGHQGSNNAGLQDRDSILSVQKTGNFGNFDYSKSNHANAIQNKSQALQESSYHHHHHQNQHHPQNNINNLTIHEEQQPQPPYYQPPAIENGTTSFNPNVMLLNSASGVQQVAYHGQPNHMSPLSSQQTLQQTSPFRHQQPYQQAGLNSQNGIQKPPNYQYQQALLLNQSVSGGERGAAGTYQQYPTVMNTSTGGNNNLSFTRQRGSDSIDTLPHHQKASLSQAGASQSSYSHQQAHHPNNPNQMPFGNYYLSTEMKKLRLRISDYNDAPELQALCLKFWKKMLLVQYEATLMELVDQPASLPLDLHVYQAILPLFQKALGIYFFSDYYVARLDTFKGNMVHFNRFTYDLISMFGLHLFYVEVPQLEILLRKCYQAMTYNFEANKILLRQEQDIVEAFTEADFDKAFRLHFKTGQDSQEDQTPSNANQANNKYNIEIQSESLLKNFKRANNSEEGSRQEIGENSKDVEKAKNVDEAVDGDDEDNNMEGENRQNLFSDLLGTADEDALEVKKRKALEKKKLVAQLKMKRQEMRPFEVSNRMLKMDPLKALKELKKKEKDAPKILQPSKPVLEDKQKVITSVTKSKITATNRLYTMRQMVQKEEKRAQEMGSSGQSQAKQLQSTQQSFLSATKLGLGDPRNRSNSPEAATKANPFANSKTVNNSTRISLENSAAAGAINSHEQSSSQGYQQYLLAQDQKIENVPILAEFGSKEQLEKTDKKRFEDYEMFWRLKEFDPIDLQEGMTMDEKYKKKEQLREMLDKFMALGETEHIKRYMKFEKMNKKTQLYNKGRKISSMLKNLSTSHQKHSEAAFKDMIEEGVMSRDESQHLQIYGPRIKLHKEITKHNLDSLQLITLNESQIGGGHSMSKDNSYLDELSLSVVPENQEATAFGETQKGKFFPGFSSGSILNQQKTSGIVVQKRKSHLEREQERQQAKKLHIASSGSAGMAASMVAAGAAPGQQTGFAETLGGREQTSAEGGDLKISQNVRQNLNVNLLDVKSQEDLSVDAVATNENSRTPLQNQKSATDDQKGFHSTIMRSGEILHEKPLNKDKKVEEQMGENDDNSVYGSSQKSENSNEKIIQNQPLNGYVKKKTSLSQITQRVDQQSSGGSQIASGTGIPKGPTNQRNKLVAISSDQHVLDGMGVVAAATNRGTSDSQQQDLAAATAEDLIENNKSRAYQKKSEGGQRLKRKVSDPNFSVSTLSNEDYRKRVPSQMKAKYKSGHATQAQSRKVQRRPSNTHHQRNVGGGVGVGSLADKSQRTGSNGGRQVGGGGVGGTGRDHSQTNSALRNSSSRQVLKNNGDFADGQINQNDKEQVHYNEDISQFLQTKNTFMASQGGGGTGTETPLDPRQNQAVLDRDSRQRDRIYKNQLPSKDIQQMSDDHTTNTNQDVLSQLAIDNPQIPFPMGNFHTILSPQQIRNNQAYMNQAYGSGTVLFNHGNQNLPQTNFTTSLEASSPLYRHNRGHSLNQAANMIINSRQTGPVANPKASHINQQQTNGGQTTASGASGTNNTTIQFGKFAQDHALKRMPNGMLAHRRNLSNFRTTHQTNFDKSASNWQNNQNQQMISAGGGVETSPAQSLDNIQSMVGYGDTFNVNTPVNEPLPSHDTHPSRHFNPNNGVHFVNNNLQQNNQQNPNNIYQHNQDLLAGSGSSGIFPPTTKHSVKNPAPIHPVVLGDFQLQDWRTIQKTSKSPQQKRKYYDPDVSRNALKKRKPRHLQTIR